LPSVPLRLDGDDVSAPEYERPARIFPSHAYQLAQVFHQQVELLIKGHGDIAAR
jgi:hypothetical protein